MLPWRRELLWRTPTGAATAARSELLWPRPRENLDPTLTLPLPSLGPAVHPPPRTQALVRRAGREDDAAAERGGGRIQRCTRADGFAF